MSEITSTARPADCINSGDQRRIAFARLILKSPSLILTDEPTSDLEHVNADPVMEILAEQARHGALMLISTHSDHAISLESTDNATEVLSASIHRSA